MGMKIKEPIKKNENTEKSFLLPTQEKIGVYIYVCVYVCITSFFRFTGVQINTGIIVQINFPGLAVTTPVTSRSSLEMHFAQPFPIPKQDLP